MQWSVCVLAAAVHVATSTFYHELSSIDLGPSVNKPGAAFGFSLAYQAGNTPKLLIGSPLYDGTGRVFKCPLEGVKNAAASHEPTFQCKALNNDLDAMGVDYSREFSLDQQFYLGASIAATGKFFLTCAPLRTAFLRRRFGFGAYGACFIYDETGTVTLWTGPGREDYLKEKLRQKIKEEDIKWNDKIYGGHGWTTLVDEVHDRIIVARTFMPCDAYVGKISEPKGSYRSLVKDKILNETKVSGFASYAHAMTLGNYFDPKKENTLYAINIMFENAEGGFHLLDSKSMKVVFEWRDSSVGSMFGSALASSDVTGDARADLLVGAPAHADDEACWDRGALHIFAAKPDEQKLELKLTIRGVHDGARFATSLAAYDVDGDSYPEIIVGAPFGSAQESVIYVLCGYQIRKILTQQGSIKKREDISIPVSDLRTQKIKRAYKNFGFSLLPIVDLDDNGSGELLVGSPDQSKVTLYRGIPSITVDVTSRISNRPAGAEFEYAFLSCAAVRRPQKPKIIATKLSVSNVLHGYDAVFKSGKTSYLVDLSVRGKQLNNGLEEYCQELVIKSTTACTVTTNLSLADDITKIKEFSNTWVRLSEQSKTHKSMLLTCTCTNIEDCKPELSVQLQWSGNQTGYVIGSSRVENVSIVVHNSGTRACAACVRVRVRGAAVDQLRCDYRKGGDYKCYLPSPFKQNVNETIDLKLLMDVSNQDKGLEVEVKLKKNCEESEEVTDTLKVPYVFREDLVSVQGSGLNYSLSNIELQNENEDILTEEQTYTIVTTESVTWKNVEATITLKKEPYIQDLKTQVSVASKPVQNCNSINDTDSFSAVCILTLPPNSTVEVTVFATVIKKEITSHMKDWQITIPSELELQLSSDITKHHTVTTVIMLQKQALGQNKTLIIIIAVIVGLVLLALLSFILYKVGFFKRKKKEELKDLKQEFRKRSTRRDREASQRSHSRQADSHCDMEDLVILEESPFDDPTPAEQFTSCAPAPDAKKAS